MNPTPKQISNKLLYASPQKVTDVGVIFGAKSISGTLAREAAQLYKAGAFKEIVLTGGTPVRERDVLTLLSLNFAKIKKPHLTFTCFEDFTSQETEAEYMHRILVDNEVPKSAITFVDQNSHNTGDNVENIKDYLSSSFNSATLLTVAYQQRRVLGTMRMHPELDHMPLVNHPVYPFGFTAENWSQTLISGLVKLDYDRLDPDSKKTYLGQYCLDPDIEAEIEYTSDLPDFTMP